MLNGKHFVLALGSLIAVAARAQFTGPGAPAPATTVAELRDARMGGYFTVSGKSVAHLSENYCAFRDGSGEVRVEIEPAVWQSRKLGPDDKVRVVAELGQGAAGRYLWIKSLDVGG